MKKRLALLFLLFFFGDGAVQAQEREIIEKPAGKDQQLVSDSLADSVGFRPVRAKNQLTAAAVSELEAHDFVQGMINYPEQLIQGKLAGVQLSAASGEVGAAVSVHVRGIGSLAGSSPLYVVDGIPLPDYSVSPGGEELGLGSSAARNPLNFLHPGDIERIEVLKDAAAAAIYGTRGGNGVVIITTKSGSGKSRQLSYGSMLSISERTGSYNLLDRDQFLSGIENLGGDWEIMDHRADTDWQDQVFRTAASHLHELAYAHQYQDGHFRASLSYNNQEGVMRNSGLERITGRLNARHFLFRDRLELGVNATFSSIHDEHAPMYEIGGIGSGLPAAAYLANPSWPAEAEIQAEPGRANPLALLEYTQDQAQTQRQLLSAFGEYEINENLRFRLHGGYGHGASVRAVAYSPLLLFHGIHDKGRAYQAELESHNQLLEGLLIYEKEFSRSRLSALAGYAYQQFGRSGSRLQSWGFAEPDPAGMLKQLSESLGDIQQLISEPYQQLAYSKVGDELFITSPNIQKGIISIPNAPDVAVKALAEERFSENDELQSFFGRLQYSLQDKYYFTTLLRADGSTRFGENYRYGYFPAAAFAWRLSDESFVPHFFDELKVRVSYGLTGNHQIPPGAYRQRQQFSGLRIQNNGMILHPGITTIGFQNPDLKWEKNSQLNLGVDFSILAAKLHGAIELYREVSTDLFLLIPSIQPAPQPFLGRNTDAELINSGIELSLNYQALARESTSLDFALYAAFNKNRLLNFKENINAGGIRGQGLTGAYTQRIEEGVPLFTYYLRNFEGFDEHGLAVYEKDAPQLTGKSALPKYTLGFNTSFQYKQWHLGTFLYGHFGHYLYHNTANAFFTKGTLAQGRNVADFALASEESPVNAPDASTRFLEKGDFLRMQNLIIGYQFLFKQAMIEHLQLNLIGQNLLALSSYSGPDPELNAGNALAEMPSLGIDYNTYPRARTASLGLKATF